MRYITTLCSSFIYLISFATLAMQSKTGLPQPAEQATLLSNSITNQTVYIDNIEDSGVFTGYVEATSGVQYPIDVYLNGTITLCLKQPPYTEFRVCLSHTLLEQIEGDEKYMDPVNLTERQVLHVFTSGKARVVASTLHYYEYEDLLEFKVAGELSKSQQTLAKRVVKSSVEKAEKAFGSYGQLDHPQVPADLIHITLVEEIGPYQFTALLKSKDFPAKLTTVHARRVDNNDTFKVTFIDKDGLPNLYGYSYQYRPKFYGKPFSGKPIYEICRFDKDDNIQDCGEYWLNLSKYFQDEAERDIFNYIQG
ncbi:hypothetical protein [Idiomarina piscisalsi]|uniref:hypothetical protein n=1 Tax=Idiomarina piscisalsi TaxID=1096243 RepID=UPI0013850B2B|nr:hypothetical protein [Idiomarina piscisalsi]MTJ01742.1 hypothetical protein [Idiomarina piscisalsi]